MNKPEIPVIFTHFNQQPNYLKFALKSAINLNKTVVLIGDDTNKFFWKNHWNTTQIVSDKYENFQKSYVHMSTNSQQFELFCFKRFFYLEKWMKEKEEKKVFLLDSDVISFANYSDQAYINIISENNYIAALMTPKYEGEFRWASSPHFSYWTIEGLEDFTSFCMEAYNNKIRDKLEQKFKWHIENNKSGGICDMTLLYLWSQNNPKVANFTKVIDDMIVEHCINVSANYLEDEYQMQLGVKKIIFKNGIPYGFNKVLNKEIRFLCIHCQGTAKILMRFFYDENLRPFYLVAKFVEIIKTTTKLFIEKITKKG
jgi:hypothetical protein